MTLLVSCSNKNQIDVYTVTYEDETKQILYDGTYLYNFNINTKNMTDKRFPTTENTEPCLYLLTGVMDYNLIYEMPGSYAGDYMSGCAYVNYLMSIGYSETSHTATQDYYDILLHSDKDRVRVIITNNSHIKIFCENSGKIPVSPPYINDKREAN
jgi:hypothetical protein